MAIGRHGNFFHWGFAASPADMTEEAKSVFANAIVYISQFDGQKPIARKYDEQIITRDVVKKFAYRATREAYEKSLARDERYDQMKKKAQQAIREKQAKGGTLNDAELLFLNYQTPKQKLVKNFCRKIFRNYTSCSGQMKKDILIISEIMLLISFRNRANMILSLMKMLEVWELQIMISIYWIRQLN